MRGLVSLFLIPIFSMLLCLFIPTAVQADETKGSAIVLATSLRVRNAPSLQSTITGTLPKNTVVTVIAKDSYGWSRIVSGRVSGWVAGYYLQEQTEDAAQKPKRSEPTSSPNKSKGSSIKEKLIVIDPGHGGKDSGGVGKKYSTYEKNINLSTANYTANLLREAGAKVKMTRNDDVNPSLSSRVNLSEEHNADAFISIHYNLSPKPVSGTLTFFYSKSKDMLLARKIESELRQKLDLKSNGISSVTIMY